MLSESIESKLMKIINCKIYVVLKDSTMFIGVLKAFDHHWNLVLADCEKFLENNILGPPTLDEPNIQKRLLGLVFVRGQNIVSIDNKPGINVPKVPITDIVICKPKDYRCGKTTIKPLVSMRNVQEPNGNIENARADILIEKDSYYIPMVDPTAFIIRGRHRPPPPTTVLISEDCPLTMDNCLATNELPVMADIDQNEPLPSMSSMSIGKLITEPGMGQNGPLSMSGMGQNRPPMPYMGNNGSPIRPGMGQNGPPSMSGMAQNRPTMLYMGNNGSPIRPGMGQNGPPSMSGMAQNRPTMLYMGNNGSPIRLGMGQNGPPSMSGMAQNRPTMLYMGNNGSPIRPGMGQNGPPSMSGMAQNRPTMLNMGNNGSPIRLGMGQNGPPSMSGMAQNRPTMLYMGNNGSPIRLGMGQNGPPSMSGMTQNRPPMPYMGKGRSSTMNKNANQ